MVPNVVTIIGTTGVGKSQLAIDLATSLRNNFGNSTPRAGEIINADSMQVYRGLDVITNKATPKERREVPHHLMDFLAPGEEYRVDKFRSEAMETIADIDSRQVLPIVVGGTMYFIQHLMFPGQLVSASDAKDASTRPLNMKVTTLEQLSSAVQERAAQLPLELLDLLFMLQDLPSISTPDAFPSGFPLESLPVEFQDPERMASALYRILQVIDPKMAERWHWRDIRKVRRSIEIALQTGSLHSDIIAQQQEVVERPEYRSLVFWLHADPSVLDPRLDSRVEKMIDRGLLTEILEMRSIAREASHLDLTKGIYQSIGYKEFQSYFDEIESGRRDSLLQERLFKDALTQMKLGTRQYARRQIKWIRNKFLSEVKKSWKANESEGAEKDVWVYVLDATDPSQWDEQVKGPALALLRSFLSMEQMPDPFSTSTRAQELLHPLCSDTRVTNSSRRKIVCEICTTDPLQPVLLEEGEQMQAHKQTRSHRKRAQKQVKQAQSEIHHNISEDSGAQSSEGRDVVDALTDSAMIKVNIKKEQPR